MTGNTVHRALVTGGAGFIGRWVVAELLDRGHRVRVFDDCSSGSADNLAEFKDHAAFDGLIVGDIRDRVAVEALFHDEIDVCYHLAAKINVQSSIDDPGSVIDNDVLGTFNVLEAVRRQFLTRGGAAGPRFVFVSTCMVYAPWMPSDHPAGIDETHGVQALSPYAAAKLAGEHLALSYFAAYGLPAVVLRPFNTYGPFQRTDTEGGVVAVFLERALSGDALPVRGDGCQTRDLLFVGDCARFIADAGLTAAADGMVLNAGSGRDITINDLAARIARDRSDIRHVRHDHPQAEIARLVCDSTRARTVLGWRPRVSLDDGLMETERWVVGAVRRPVAVG